MILLSDMGGHASTGSQPKYVEGRRQLGLVPRINQQRPDQGGIRGVGHARRHLDNGEKAPGQSVCRVCLLRCSAASDPTQSVLRGKVVRSSDHLQDVAHRGRTSTTDGCRKYPPHSRRSCWISAPCSALDLRPLQRWVYWPLSTEIADGAMDLISRPPSPARHIRDELLRPTRLRFVHALVRARPHSRIRQKTQAVSASSRAIQRFLRVPKPWLLYARRPSKCFFLPPSA
jgi:hypothetical protein